MKRITVLSALLILLIGSAVAMAQPPHGKRGAPGWRQHRNPKEMTEAFRLYKMTEYLELSEEQTAKIFPRLAAIKKQQEEHMERMKATMKDLRELVKEEEWTKAAKLAEEVHAMKAEHMAAMLKAHGDLATLLSDEQRAKFMLFEHRFSRHLKQMGERMKGGKGSGGHPGMGQPGPGGDCDGSGAHGPGPCGNCGPGGW